MGSNGKTLGRPSNKAFLGLIILGVVWGFFFVLSRFAGETEVTPMVLVSYIIVAELPFFYLICFWRGKLPLIWRPASMLFYLMAATLGYFIPAVLELHSAPIIGAGLLTIFVSMTPLITVVTAFLMRTETKSLRKLIGVLIGTIALLPMMLSEDIIMPNPDKAMLGFALALLVSLCYGIYHNFVSKFWPDGEDAWQLATGETTAGFFVLVPFTLLIFGFEIIPISGIVLPFIIGSYLILSITSIWLYFFLLKEAGPIFTSLAGFVSLLVGVLLGMIFFGERHPPWIVICMIAIIIASAVIIIPCGAAGISACMRA